VSYDSIFSTIVSGRRPVRSTIVEKVSYDSIFSTTVSPPAPGWPDHCRQSQDGLAAIVE
jgi:hypothetical protein